MSAPTPTATIGPVEAFWRFRRRTVPVVVLIGLLAAAFAFMASGSTAIGHLNILRRARERCDTLIAGVVTDDVVEQMKGRRPIVPFEERIEIVRAIGFVDEAVLDESADKRLVWQRAHFDVVFKGDDWRGTAAGARLEALLLDVDARVEYLPYTANTSSTMLRELLDDVLKPL